MSQTHTSPEVEHIPSPPSPDSKPATQEQQQKMATEKIKDFQCPVCGKRFSTRVELNKHKTAQH